MTMTEPIIDSHIHLDLYTEAELVVILNNLESSQVQALISVSNNIKSARKTQALSKRDERIKPAYGYHPEQELPAGTDLLALQAFIDEHQAEMIAIGEVGLPYYLRQKDASIPLAPYVELLELFIQQAKRLEKPLILHAVYDDAALVCELLEKHSVDRAHFHWFKGDQKTIHQMIRNGYFISITPDVLYEEEIRALVATYPISKMMVETDGPWRFSGIFNNQRTEPKMIHQTIQEIAHIKQMKRSDVYDQLLKNTKQFYNLEMS